MEKEDIKKLVKEIYAEAADCGCPCKCSKAGDKEISDKHCKGFHAEKLTAQKK
jgi:hypothetical protein